MSYSQDIQCFNRLFNEYYERFIRFASGYVRERQIAEDFVSEAFALYWENRESLLPETKPQAYILTIITNKCLNYLQHLQVCLRAEQVLSKDAEWQLNSRINSLKACDPDFLFSQEIQQIIEATLKRLPQKTRRIFVMSRYEGLSYRAIAQRMNLSIKTVEFHISKTLAYLRLSLKDFICFFPLLFYCY